MLDDFLGHKQIEFIVAYAVHLLCVRHDCCRAGCRAQSLEFFFYPKQPIFRNIDEEQRARSLLNRITNEVTASNTDFTNGKIE